MQVLYVTPYYKPAYVYGGPVQSMSALCGGLVRSGVDLTVVTTNANGKERLKVDLRCEIIIDGVKVLYFPVLLNKGYIYSPELGRVIRHMAGNATFVICEGIWNHTLLDVAWTCRRKQIPFIVPVRGQLQPWSLRLKPWKKKIYMAIFGKWGLNNATALLCTDYIEATALERLNLRPPVLVIPNGIDVERYSLREHYSNFRCRMGIPEQAIVLSFLGRLTKIKRPDIAVYALAAARQKTKKDVHLLMVGPDEAGLSEELFKLAESLGCRESLHMTGLLEQDQVIEALANSTLLLMPTEVQENFGMSALEGLAAGLPIFVSNGVPVGQWAQQAGAGLSLPATIEAFSDAVVEYLCQPEILLLMSQQSKLLVRQVFDQAVVADRLLVELNKLLKSDESISEDYK